MGLQLSIRASLKMREIYLSCFMAVKAIIGPWNIAADNEEAEEYSVKRGMEHLMIIRRNAFYLMPT